MPDFLFLLTKHIHVWCVTLSFLLFVVRAAWHLKQSEQLQRRWVKITPHVIDTLLLITGLILVSLLSLQQATPFWLKLKIALVLVYIISGILAFKLKKSRKLTFGVAIAAFAGIVFLAVTKPLVA